MTFALMTAVRASRRGDKIVDMRKLFKLRLSAVLVILLCDFSAIFVQCATAAPPAHAQQNSLQLRFLVSETCSLHRFLDILTDDPHATSWVKNWYFEKRGADGDCFTTANGRHFRRQLNFAVHHQKMV